MAVSAEARRAMDLMEGIAAAKEGGDDAELWRGIASRVIADLNEAGEHAAVRVVSAMLAGLWSRLPDRNGAPEPPRVSKTGNETADMIAAGLARSLAAAGLGRARSARYAERIRGSFAVAYGGDPREAPRAAELTPREQYERATERWGAAAASLAQARAASARMLAEAQAALDAAAMRLREFESSPGVPRDEYREVAGGGGDS